MRRFLLSGRLGFRQIEAQTQQTRDRLAVGGAVQKDSQPLILVHVIGREEARPAPQGTDQKRIALEIQDVRNALPILPQRLIGHPHHQSKPFTIVAMPEYTAFVIPWERKLQADAVRFRDVIDQFLRAAWIIR